LTALLLIVSDLGDPDRTLSAEVQPLVLCLASLAEPKLQRSWHTVADCDSGRVCISLHLL